MRSKNSFWNFLLFSSLLLLPIDSFPLGIYILREFGARVVNFLLLLLLCYFVSSALYFRKIDTHKSCFISFFILLVLFFWSSSVLTYEFIVGTASIDFSAFLLQGMMLFWAFISFFVWLSFFNKFASDFRGSSFNFIKIDGWVIILSSLIIVLLFFGDYLFAFCTSPGDDLLSLLRLKGECFRPSGLASEPSLFGAWCNFIIPFLMVTLKNRSIKLSIISLIIFAALMSGARTFVVIACFQMILFLLPSLWIAAFISAISIAMYPLAYNLFSDIDLSVLARLSSSYAALLGFVDSPLMGYGIGQFSVHFPSYVPSDALISEEVYAWYSGSATYRISTFSLPLRLLFEFGLLGGGVFLSFIMAPFVLVKKAKIPIFEMRCLFALIVGVQGFIYSQDQYAYQILIFTYAFIYSLMLNQKAVIKR